MSSPERWMPISGFVGIYSVSDLGRVRRDSSGRGARVGTILKSHVGQNDYPRVVLHGPGALKKTCLVHRLVVYAFIGDPNGQVTNHKNGNKADNSLGNLELVSQAENVRHAYLILGKRGGRYLPDSLVKEVMRAIDNASMTQAAIAKSFGLCEATVSNIKNRRSYQYVWSSSE